jgi:cell division protein FtsB
MPYGIPPPAFGRRERFGIANAAQNRLLLTPAAADNAAMQAEPPQADPPKRKRRWFQFSLRTLLILVTLLAVLSAAVTWVIQDRQRLVRERDEAMGREADAKQTLNTIQQENRVLVNQLHQIYREQPGGF